LTKKQKQKRMKDAVEYMTAYMVGYDKQIGYLDYSDETFIDDVLYGLGVALDADNRFAIGYEKFKARIVKHIGG